MYQGVGMEIALLTLALGLVLALGVSDLHAQAVVAPPDAHSLDLPMAAAYVWVAIWGAIGGLVSFYQKVRAGKARWLNINELIGEIMTSAFVGLGTGLLCVSAGAPAPLTYALVGITGHMGGRAIFWAEKALQQWAENKFGVSVADADPDPVGTAATVVATAAALADKATLAAATLAHAASDTSHALGPDPETTLPPHTPSAAESAAIARALVHERANVANATLLSNAVKASELVKDTAVATALEIKP